MRVRAVLIYSVVLIAGFSLSSKPADTSRQPGSTDLPGPNFGQVNKKFVSEVEVWLNLLPESERNAWLGYVSSASGVHGGSNETIEIQNIEKTKGPCFSDLAAEFYTWTLQKDLSKGLSQAFDENGNERPLGDRVSMVDRAGADRFSDLAPGSVWQKALDVAGGHPNLAIALIGLCGHDDAIAVKPKLMANRPATEKYRQEKRRLMQEMNASLMDGVKSHPKIKSFVEDWLKGSEELLKPDQIDHLLCTMGSVLYVPQSLGANVDLSEDLKSKVIRVQAPTKGGTYLPAKYYHILGSAMRACDLKAQAHTAFAAIFTSPMAVRMYRAKRLGEKLSSQSSLTDKMSSTPPENITDQEITEFLRRYYKAFPKVPEAGTTAWTKYHEKISKFDRQPENWFRQIVNMSSDDRVTLESARRQITSAYSVMDASTLVRKWFEVYEIPGVGSVYLPSQKRRAKFQNLTMDGCGLEEISTERCRRALQVLDSWEVDFEWSQNQHWIGAYFGLQNCIKLRENESIESLACKALATRTNAD